MGFIVYRMRDPYEMKTEYFNYNLPKELIAQAPIKKRDDARLMVVERENGNIKHYRFRDLVMFLLPGDLLVINNTKVIPCRLIGTREVLLLKKIRPNLWEALIKPIRGLKLDEEISFNGSSGKAKVKARTEEGAYILEFADDTWVLDTGFMPLPPYIKRDYKKDPMLHEEDKSRYQTVYAENIGAIAAPTAGLHFTSELLSDIRDRGIPISTITLHTGWGTFRPVRTEYIKDHKMLKEWFSIPGEIRENIERAKRVIAVGTTTVRALETGKQGGYTDLFICPPYKFKIVDGLITNFHLPKSTLLMLVSAFAGRELIMEAYQTAIKNKYRFYSYGDAMLIL